MLTSSRLIYVYRPDFSWAAGGLAFWLVGYAALRLTKRAMSIRLLLLTGVSVAWIGLIVALALLNWADVRRAEAEGRVATVQGRALRFTPETRDRKHENLSVGGVDFEYARFNPQVGFNGSLSEEKAFRLGSCLFVRYYHDPQFGNRILRLELLETSSGLPCESAGRP